MRRGGSVWTWIMAAMLCIGALALFGVELGACSPTRAGASTPMVLPVADAAAQTPVPADYQSTYATLQTQLNALSALAPTNPTSSPTVTSAGVEAADGNVMRATGPPPSALNTSIRTIDLMKEMGQTGVTIDVAYPLLVTGFPMSASYLSFYEQLAQVIHDDGLVFTVEENPLFSNISSLPVLDWYKGLTFDSYIAQSHQEAQTIIDDLEPQYLSILGEPDTYTANLSNPTINLNMSANGATFVNGVLSGLDRENTEVGGGTGTWTTPAYDQTLIEHTSMNFLDMHSYPIAPVDLSNMRAEVAEADAAHLPIVMSECWLYKDSTDGVPDRGAQSAPDEQKTVTFGFWEPLDEQFLEAMVDYARTKDFAVIDTFNADALFAYQTWTPTLDAETPTQVAAAYNPHVSAALNAGTVSDVGGAFEDALEHLAPSSGGYDEVAADGGIFAYNTPFLGSMGGRPLDAPIVGMAQDTLTGGYYEVASDGGIFAFTAPFHGSMGGRPLDAPIVGMALDPTTGGYYEVASDGGIFAFTAPFRGSMGGRPLNAPIVGMAVDPTTGGYDEVASDGGIFAFTAPFEGSMGARPLNAPVVGIALDTLTGGYDEVASDGGIFCFDAPFLGSMGARPLDAPIVGMAVDTVTGGYYEVAADGGLFAFGAPFLGSMGGQHLDAPIVGLTVGPLS